ncbi:protein kinase domain-containing protein [Streptomyces tsukubensis]|uniref:Serine/threonine protein kinase n=1 Tax=Streptomyces tsukubensis TaxID=83656 RepID=A0A1V4ADL0_9ACTN|nr:protein kinase [Streptomyces tsukubensis]OON81645.1 serine/threonine protein kinase [Streptomyces tsukubensis]QFR96421.1 protein kinase [Streptomyces tsukubensis]
MHPLTDSDPVRIGRYRLTGRLGEGGMGTVYLGSTPGGRPVAIKVISGRFQYEEQALERFRREVGTLHTVRSAYTTSLIDCGLEAPPYWFATEYVPGRTLDAAVRASGALPARLCLGIMAALAEGLSDIHVHGVLHRDVKPQNIILSPVGPQLIDFGIARETGQTALTQVGHTAGTPGFTAPEAWQGEEVGVAADVFALGATLAFAATGRPPYGKGALPAVSYRTVHGDIDLDGVDADLARIIAACTDRAPARRPTPGEIVELCQSRVSLANDPAYQRIAAPDLAEGGAGPAPVPTAIDASAAVPGVPASAAPTLSAPVPAPTEVGPPPVPPAPVPPLGGAENHRVWRRPAVVAMSAVAAVCVVAAVLLVLQPWQSTKGTGGGKAEAGSASTPSGKSTESADTSAGSADKASDGESDGASDGAEENLPVEKIVTAPMSLRPGEEIAAARVQLTLQRDGNLVAYDETNHARWASRTRDTGARADFQPDGNLVVYDTEDRPVWASRTGGHANAVLKLQSDGNITILDGTSVLWAAGANH